MPPKGNTPTPTPNRPAPPPGPSGPRCPLCDGRLVRLRDASRCARCGFVLCAGCADGETAAPNAD